MIERKRVEWWFSWALGDRFVGGCFAHGDTFDEALMDVMVNGGRPPGGGQLVGIELPVPAPPEAEFNRTYSRDEVEALWGAVEPYAVVDDE